MQALKASPKLKDVPVIFLTALSDIADKVKAFEVGGVDYITKPFHLEEVQARVPDAPRAQERDVARSYEKLKRLEELRETWCTWWSTTCARRSWSSPLT